MAEFPPLPQGFTPVEQDEAPDTATASDGGFPPLPAGFAPVEEEAPPAPKRIENERDFGLELTRRIREHDINSQEEADAFARDFGPEGIRVDVADTIAARDEGAQVTNKTITDDSVELWLAHKQAKGEDITPYLQMPTDQLLTMANNDFREQVAASMERRGIDVNSGRVVRFLGGLGRSPEQLLEGLAQLGIRGAEATGIIEETMADDAIAFDARVRDEAAVRGTAGGVGNFVGDVAITAPLPFKGVSRFASGAANTGATIAKRAASGAAAAGLKPTDTGGEQALNALLGAVAAPVLAPVAERVFGLIGDIGAQTYMRVTNQGVGNRIFRPNGELTPYGKALRIRLKAVNPDLPDEFIDETLLAIRQANPRRLPADEVVVQDTLAAREGVPLTGAMKERDIRGIQDFESAQAGAFGEGFQKQAVEADKAIDDAVRGNIREISPTGEDSADAAAKVGRSLQEAEGAAASVRDDAYEALKASNERITDPSRLRDAIKAFNDDLAGQAEADILPPIVKAQLRTLLELSKRGAMSASRALKVPEKLPGAYGKGKEVKPPKPLRFGELWAFSRQLNEMARSSTGPEGVYLNKLRKRVNDFISGMSDDMFESGSSGVAKQLRDANRINKNFMDTFAARSARTRSGRNARDRAGEALEDIVTHVRQTTKRGEPINPAHVERSIFGSAKSMSSSSATDAVNIIRRVIKAAPETADAIKAMSVNRVLNQVEQGLFDKSLRPDTLQTKVKEIVDGNRQILEAAGWSKADITRLQLNAYLASLKALPKGARNPSGSGKWVKTAIGTAFRRSVATLAAGSAGGAAIGAVDPLAAAMVGTVWVGSKALNRRVAKRALSGKVRAKGKGNKVTKKTGQIGAASLVRQIGNPDDEGE